MNKVSKSLNKPDAGYTKFRPSNSILRQPLDAGDAASPGPMVILDNPESLGLSPQATHDISPFQPISDLQPSISLNFLSKTS